jgi:hypothetical protein
MTAVALMTVAEATSTTKKAGRTALISTATLAAILSATLGNIAPTFATELTRMSEPRSDAGDHKAVLTESCRAIEISRWLFIRINSLRYALNLADLKQCMQLRSQIEATSRGEGFAMPTVVMAISQYHTEVSTETTFSNIVKNERLRVCAGTPISTCNSDFDIPALLAEWLDAEEERATMMDKSGEEETAQEVRMQILSDAAMLDIWMDQIRLLHRKN